MLQMPLNKEVEKLAISGIRQFFNMVAKYDHCLSLTIGQPDFHTPEHIKTATIDALHNNATVYTPNAGLPQLREAISDFVATKYNQHYCADEVIVTIGASQAIDIALRTILSPGDEVIIPTPIYPGYEPLVRLAGATPIFVDTADNDFKLTSALLAPHLTERTTAIILPFPSNPTGVCLTSEELDDLAHLLRDQPIWLLSDEIYSELTFNGQHDSIATRLREQTIVINGVSKSHSMTGFRIGFTLAPASLSSQMVKIHQYNVSCATSISQHAALAALTAGRDDALPMRETYAKRMNYVYERLVTMGFDVVKPDGAFYLFPSIEKFGLSSFDFALKLVEEQRVALVPGSAFGASGDRFIRLSYACDDETLVEAMNRLERFIQQFSSDKA